jgi:hypothetical protein
MGFTLNQLEQERQIRKLQKKEDKDTSNYEQLSNLPKINNVELKGDKTTSDLGINADNVMLSDGVTSVDDALTNVTSGTFTGNLGFTFGWSKCGKILNLHAGNDTTKVPQGDTIIGDIPDNILPVVNQITFDCNRSFVNKCSFILNSSTKKISLYCDIPTGTSSPYYVQGNATYICK